MREAVSNWDLKKIDVTFPYLQLLMREKPEYPERRKMDLVHRAKIFSAFDALEGYSELIRKTSNSFDEKPREKREPNICAFWDDP